MALDNIAQCYLYTVIFAERTSVFRFAVEMVDC